MPGEKPRGSGIFAIIFGVLFLLALVASFQIDFTKLPREVVVRAWLLFVTAVLICWGANRVRIGGPSLTVGQATINFVVGLIGATFALIALFGH